MLESTEKGGVRNSIRNCLTVFQNDPLLSGAIAKNLLTERTDIIKPIGYHRTGTAITDTDMNYLQTRPLPGRLAFMWDLALPLLCWFRCSSIILVTACKVQRDI